MSTLSREQVVESLDDLESSTSFIHRGFVAVKMKSHDATQRALLRQREEEIERLKQESEDAWLRFAATGSHDDFLTSLDGMVLEHFQQGEKIADLTAQLTAIRSHVRQYAYEATFPLEEIVRLDIQQHTAELNTTRRQLTASQQRCAELEGALKLLDSAARSLVCTSPYHFEGNDVTLAEALVVAQDVLTPTKRLPMSCERCAELEKALKEARCPYCDAVGWTVQPDRNTGEPCQVQCEWCDNKNNLVPTERPPT